MHRLRRHCGDTVNFVNRTTDWSPTMPLKDLLKNRGQGKFAEASPPDYTSHQYYRDEDVPGYAPPHFSGVAGGSTTLAPATRKFPPKLISYGKWSSSAFYLGPSENEKLFAASFDSGWFRSKAPVTIYNGPTHNHPVLSSVSPFRGSGKMECTLTVFPTPGSSLGEPLQIQCGYSSATWKDARYAFTVPVTSKPGGKDCIQPGTFEWRSTEGDEMKEVCGGRTSRGWKLVRVNGPETGQGGKRGARDHGFTSDGTEIVAVSAYHPGWSMSKGLVFAFMGTGLTGQLGAEWEVAAVTTGVLMFFMAVTGQGSS